MGWVRPTGYETPTDWTNCPKAYDNSVGTQAAIYDVTVNHYSDWLNLTHAMMYCDKVRVHGRHDQSSGTAQVRLFYGEQWHTVYSGYLIDQDWKEIDLGESFAITKVGFRQVRLYFTGGVVVNEIWLQEGTPPYIPPPPSSVWSILSKLLARVGIFLWYNPYCAQSDAINDLNPILYVRQSSQGDTELRNLLAMVTDSIVPRAGLMFTKDLAAAEESCYQYNNAPGYHRILKGEYLRDVLITHAQVGGEEKDTETPVIESAFDWDNLIQGIDNLALKYDPDIEETDQAQWRADALLRHETQGEHGGQITVPVNCGHELYDVITVTDPRCGIVAGVYRIVAIETVYDTREGRYSQKLTLAAP